MIRQKSGETETGYFYCLKSEGVNAEISKGNLTKHEKLEKSERDDGNNTNPEKVVEDKFLAMDFIGCSDPVR